jgi:cell division protein FtsQ
VGLLALFFVDDRFYVQAAELNGLRYSDRGEVLRRAGVHGYSIFWLDRTLVAGQLEALPFVKQASVRPLLPDRVRIDLVERQPVATWLVAGQTYWIDQEGVLLSALGQLQGAPLLEDVAGATLHDRGQVDPQLVASVQELHRALPQVGRFAYEQGRGLIFTLPSGTQVAVGSQQGLSQRVQELLALQAALAGQGQAVSEIDLSHPGGYYYRPGP